MKKGIKIVVTLLLVLCAGLYFLLNIAIAGTSHTMSDESRTSAIQRGWTGIAFAVVLTVLLWIPWHKQTR